MSNPFSFGSSSIVLERNKILTITKKTLRSNSSVYQLCNISSFSEGAVDIGTIPWIVIMGVFVVGLIVGIVDGNVGVFIMLISVAAVVWNFLKPKHYGLLITENSGDKTLFVTTDQPGLQQAIQTTYDTMIY